MAVTAQEIVAGAERLGLVLEQGMVPSCDGNKSCAKWVLAEMTQRGCNDLELVADRFDITVEDILAIEAGFEDWSSSYRAHLVNNPYYKVGEEVRKLAGIDAED